MNRKPFLAATSAALGNSRFFAPLMAEEVPLRLFVEVA